MKTKSTRNRTLTLTEEEVIKYSNQAITVNNSISQTSLINKTIHQDLFSVLDFLPNSFIDLLFIDPPYNLTKIFNSSAFNKTTDENYKEYIDNFLSKLVRCLKPTASIYICCDWKCSSAIYDIMKKYFIIRNRITWEREKGRGSKTNWKNCSEDIWFATASNDYYYDADSVKLKRKVIAPYRDSTGNPKDWEEKDEGNFRLTCPSNLWTDISIPFWSMPENTEHPTQKPEKLMAKIILASSKENDFVFDPFLGSGTTSVVAKKLNRKYCGIERDKTYSALTERRLELAESNFKIQGYSNGVFWERNSGKDQKE
jgi:site-specific DNA-methyltransferase (adenine-specific)